MYVGIVPTFFGNMRIAQDLWMSQVRKAGQSLTVRSAAKFTRGCSGRTRLVPDRRHERERGHFFPWVPGSGWPLPLAKPIGWQNGGKMAQKGGKTATFAGTCYVTICDATPLLPCGCVNCRRKERRETNSHNHLFIKNLRRKYGFPNFQKSRKT